MSTLPSVPPRDSLTTPPIAHVLPARPRDLGGFTVGRALPSAIRRMVGPFIFFDHMGPAQLAAGHGMDVRPHPHINLSTVTYLFDGEIEHRDSLGSVQVIKPGAINWMTAGHGIVHSERTPADVRARGSVTHGLQLWVALPTEDEERPPSFVHHAADTLPTFTESGVRARLLAGTAYGVRAPVETLSPLFYLDVHLDDGAGFVLPPECTDKALYVVEGAVHLGAERVEPRKMIVFAPGAPPVIYADGPTRVVFIGGDRLDGERHIWWNFVSSSHDRIQEAKEAWEHGRFATVPGDSERIPLPAE